MPWRRRLLDAFTEVSDHVQRFQQSKLLWPRPWLVAGSSFKNMLRIDSYAVVFRPLGELFPEL